MNVKFSSPTPQATLAACCLVLALARAAFGDDSARTEHLGGRQAAPSGQRLLADAARRGKTHATVTAKFRVRTHLLDQPLVGSGEYAQLRTSQGLLLRLELTMRSGGFGSNLIQISDGRNVWLHRNLDDDMAVGQVDLTRVKRALTDGPEDLTPTNMLAVGGVPRLLRQLAETFDFDREPPRTGSVADLPVWVATGIWKLDALHAVAPNAVSGNEVHFDQVPPHLPHQVRIKLGQSDLFPYRLTFFRWETSDGREPRLTPVVEVEFFAIEMGQPLDPRQFIYRPDNLTIHDQTDRFLRSLKVARRGSGQTH